MKFRLRNILQILAAIPAFFAIGIAPAAADSGFYLGVGAGSAAVEANIGDPSIPELPDEFDEDDTAYKLFAGYHFDLPLIDLGIEGGWVDFGAPEVDVLGEPLVIDFTGVNLWGTAGLELGPINVYGKLGYVLWDAEATFADERISEDDSDIGYGLGVSFNIGSLQVRGEYEIYDLEGDTDLSMLSVGLAYRF